MDGVPLSKRIDLVEAVLAEGSKPQQTVGYQIGFMLATVAEAARNERDWAALREKIVAKVKEVQS